MDDATRPDPRVDNQRFGSLAHQLGYVTLKQVQSALAAQIEDDITGQEHRLLGTIFREKGWITQKEEEEILARLDSLKR